MKKKDRSFSWLNPNIEVKNTGNYGSGIFAKKNIKKGEKLAIFGGYVVRIDEEPIDTGIQIDDNLILTSFDHNDPADFVNHSCNPNAGIKGQNFLVSMKKIKKGEQVCFDYAMCLYSKNKSDFYSLDCKCGSKKCRGKVTSNDWKIPELQKKYRGYFEQFLQDKIKRI